MSTDSTYAVYTRLPSLLVHLARRAEHHAERARGHDDRTTGEGGGRRAETGRSPFSLGLRAFLRSEELRVRFLKPKLL